MVCSCTGGSCGVCGGMRLGAIVGMRFGTTGCWGRFIRGVHRRLWKSVSDRVGRVTGNLYRFGLVCSNHVFWNTTLWRMWGHSWSVYGCYKIYKANNKVNKDYSQARKSRKICNPETAWRYSSRFNIQNDNLKLVAELQTRGSVNRSA